MSCRLRVKVAVETVSAGASRAGALTPFVITDAEQLPSTAVPAHEHS